MKKFFVLFALCAFFAGCNSNDDPVTPTQGLTIDDAQLTVDLPGDQGTHTVRFHAYEKWSASVTSTAGTWCRLSPTNGSAGDISMTVTADANTTNAARTATITLRAGEVKKEIQVTQAAPQVLTVTPTTTFRVNQQGEEIEVKVTANVAYECSVAKNCESWIKKVSETPETGSGTTTVTTYRFRIEVYGGSERREGSIYFSTDSKRVEVTVLQGDFYESTDFSKDGQVLTLQKATEGNGINLIFMGDAFTDRLIDDGTYERVMRQAMEDFFSIEPYASFQQLFNVYAVIAVSTHEEYYDGAKTALAGYFGEGTEVGGKNDYCRKYALKIDGMTSRKLEENALIIVMMNREYYAGTCYMTQPSTKTDYGNGEGIAYFPLGTDRDMFKILLWHEAGGHGFAKLADEYSFPANGSIPASEISQVHTLEQCGWLKNIDLTNDEKQIKWSSFIADQRYAPEGVGVYAGGHLYPRGVYRPTKSSLMNDNTGGYNAPSREAIYYRIHKLAYGESWEYDYETFVTYDRAAQNKAAALMAPRNEAPRYLAPLHPPVIRMQSEK